MIDRAIVILTDPAQCEIADTEMLVQAILQIQQLNKAGLASSQAFCDHPNAAMTFLEAYTRAYPELQDRSSDLPPPDVLHSVVTDGRLKPLQAIPAPDLAKPDEVSKTYPLYVLSLGTPEILIRAMDDNRFGTSEIQLVEITPPEAEQTKSVSVAEAVDQEAPTGPSWHAETSAERKEHDEDFLPIELGVSDPLKLQSVEIDLDHIPVEGQQDSKSHPKVDQPAPLVVSPVSGAASYSNEGQQSQRDQADGSSLAIGDPLVQTAHKGAIVSDLNATALSEADAGSPGAAAASAPSVTTPLTTAPEGEALELVLGSESESVEAESGGVEESHGPGTVNEGSSSTPCNHEGNCQTDNATAAASAADDNDDDYDDDGGTTLNPLNSASSGERTSNLESRTWSGEPTPIGDRSLSYPEDVVYQPNDSFAVVDVTYPSADSLPENDWIKDLFADLENSEVVDLATVFNDFSNSMSAVTSTLSVLHLELVQVGDACRVRSDQAAHSRLEPGIPAPSPDGQDAHQESEQHLGLPVVHDVDL